jgi:hypothetical protein
MIYDLHALNSAVNDRGIAEVAEDEVGGISGRRLGRAPE